MMSESIESKLLKEDKEELRQLKLREDTLRKELKDKKQAFQEIQEELTRQKDAHSKELKKNDKTISDMLKQQDERERMHQQELAGYRELISASSVEAYETLKVYLTAIQNEDFICCVEQSTFGYESLSETATSIRRRNDINTGSIINEQLDSLTLFLSKKKEGVASKYDTISSEYASASERYAKNISLFKMMLCVKQNSMSDEEVLEHLLLNEKKLLQILKGNIDKFSQYISDGECKKSQNNSGLEESYPELILEDLEA